MRRSAGLLGVALAVAFATACDDLAPCDEQGDTQPCECAGGAPGAQVCMPERIWSACDCNAPPTPDGGSAGAAGASGAGGSAGASGQSGASGAGGATPPSGGMGGNGDDDAGMDPDPGAGTGGGSGAGAGGGSGTSGSGGATAPMSAAYGGCMNANECDEGAMCLMSPPDLFGPLRVCARECGDADDCPVPEGTYDADVTCVEGRCKIDCTEMEGFPLPVPQSCPGGMICVADEFPSASAYCYDDGA